VSGWQVLPIRVVKVDIFGTCGSLECPLSSDIQVLHLDTSVPFVLPHGRNRSIQADATSVYANAVSIHVDLGIIFYYFLNAYI
jgi:hypothetical protein